MPKCFQKWFYYLFNKIIDYFEITLACWISNYKTYYKDSTGILLFCRKQLVSLAPNVIFLSPGSSVNERTKEIGTMKAIGAKPWFILSMFLSDAVFIGLIGATLGISTGIGLAYLLAASAASGGGEYIGSCLASLTNRKPTSRTFSSLESVASITSSSYACIMSNSRYKMTQVLKYIDRVSG